MKFLKKYPVAWAITIVVILASSVFGVAMAKEDMLPVTPGNWVYDGAGVLSDTTEETVRSYNASFDQNYSAFVAVATVDSLKGWEPDEYAETLFNNWELYGNDFLLMLDIGGNQSYLYNGSNYTNFDYAAYLDGYVNPDFFSGDYDSAVTKLMAGMEGYLSSSSSIGSFSGAPAGEVPAYEDYYAPDHVDYFAYQIRNVVISLVLLLIVVFVVLNALERARYRRWYNQYGFMATPTVVYRPLLFWHRPGSSWWRRNYRPGPRPGPGPGPGPGGPRPGGFGPGPGAPRPGNNGPRPSASRPSSSRPSGFGGGGSSRSGGFGGGGSSRGHGGGGFGGGGRSSGHR